MMIEALAAVLEPKVDLFATTQPVLAAGFRRWLGDWRDRAWLGLPVTALIALLVVFVVMPRLGQHPSSAAPPASGVVACPDVSPSPQVAADPNPATAGQPVTFTASGFQAGDPFFIVIDGTGDCTNPTAGVKVYNSSSYTDPAKTDPSPLPDSITPGDYQVRACNQRPGEAPTGCVQVPFSVVASPSPTAASAARS
jgi:hypothetical protein